MKDSLGDRMKGFYEDRTRHKLTRRTYTIIRVDGKAFHTYTKGLEKPFDDGLIEDMNETAAYLCKNIMGAKLAYVQSDEISVVITDFDDLSTEAWFDGNLQKMSSVAASLATAKFNQSRMLRESNAGSMISSGHIASDEIENFKLAMFDARVFQIPYREEVINYLIWRQQDATRNSISSVAQANFSTKELHGKNTTKMQDMLMLEKGINWNDFTPRQKRGGIIRKYTVKNVDTDTIRTKWSTDDETPIFTQDREYLYDLIPSYDVN